MEGSVIAHGRAGRFSQVRRGWPGDLLAALAAHAARLVDGQDAAVCAWHEGGARRELTLATSSDEPRWHAVLAALAAEPAPSAAPAVRTGHDVTLATVGFAAAGRRGLLAVGKPAGAGFTPEDLALLGDVRGLVVAALEAGAGRGARPAPPPPTPAEPPVAGDFHHRLPRAFERLEGLPALAESRNVLLGLLDDPSPSHAAIVGAIESDIALLIAVLRLANDARGSRRPTVWSVPEAVAILTPEGVETMARRITVFDFFQRIRGWAVPPEHFRLHAVATQRAAQRLVRLVDHPDPDELLVAALLHDVGKLVLMEAFSAYPAQVLGTAATPEQRLQAERRTLGLDHQMAGGVLLRRWRLPERLAEIVGRHHEDGDDRDATLIGLADTIAHYAQGQPVSPQKLERAAAAIGVRSAQLRTVMYELSQPDGSVQARLVEPSPLSKRETQIVRELARGLTYKEIAHEVGLSSSTVRSHLHNVYKKLEVVDRAQAVMAANARGWI